MLEERNAQTRLLRSELETEKTYRQFIVEESNRIQEQTRKLEAEVCNLKQELRDKVASIKTTDSSLNEGEISQKYHLLVSDQKEQKSVLRKMSGNQILRGCERSLMVPNSPQQKGQRCQRNLIMAFSHWLDNLDEE